MSSERREWPVRKLHWLDIAWGAFTLINLVAMEVFPVRETIPFHFIWVSLTILYGFRVWEMRATMWTLAVVTALTGTLIYIDVVRNAVPIDEMAEVPLMAAMFLAMVWHARSRLTATREKERMYEANLRFIERERQFIQDASHELRTPITVALGHAELVQRTSYEPLVREDARVVIDELMRLRRISDRLLLLAASEHPDFVRLRPMEIEPAVVETLRRWTPVDRQWDLGELEEATVNADADRLAVALDALIENAVKHTAPGDSISLSVSRRDGMAVVAVADTGEGIPPGDLGRIFDRFARSNGSRSRQAGGVGLGLSIVKAVAEAHGGSVSVRSTPGDGSVFEILLPMVVAPLPRPVAPPTRSRPVGSAGSGQPG